MIQIYGPPRSSAGRCYLMLEELGLPYQAMPLDMMGGGLEKPEYLKLNPNGKVPCLVDADVVMWESVAINLYLADRYKPELLGTNPKERASSYQWSMWSMTELQVPLIDLFIQQVFVPAEKRDQKLIEESLAMLPGLFTILDQALEGTEYLAGNHYTVADVNVGSVVNISLALRYDLTPFKNISSWLERMKSRPAWRKLAELRSA